MGLLGAALLMGCSGGERLTPVSGKITLGGKPLSSGGISFQPDFAKGNKSNHVPTGPIIKGEYELSTAGRKGAPAGKYKVVVFASETHAPGKKNSMELPKSLVNVRYNSSSQTPLAVEVKSDSTEAAYDFKLEP